jgi:hypothetical protein
MPERMPSVPERRHICSTHAECTLHPLSSLSHPRQAPKHPS